MIQTERLVLRQWTLADREPFSRINADPRVMEFLPAPLTVIESDQLVDRIEAHFRERGFGLFAAELQQDHSFIGFIGLSVPSFHAAFTPCVEIGWRLSAEHWGQGLATEGAQAVVR
jgi:RimJ/RimL family protein N-acetyltransferase